MDSTHPQLERSIEDFSRRYFATHRRAPRTAKAYLIDLYQFANAYPTAEPADIGQAHVENYLGLLRKRGCAPATILRKIAALRTFFRFHLSVGLMQVSPFEHMTIDVGRPRNLPRTLSVDQISMMRRTAAKQLAGLTVSRDSYNSTLRNVLIIDLLFATGIRVGELTAINLHDIDADRVRITGKGNRERLALLPKSLSALMAVYLKARGTPAESDSALLVNRFGRRLSPQGVAYILRVVARAGRIAFRVTPHMFRHSAATTLLDNGAQLRAIQEFLGHASIATTQRYTHVSTAHLRQTLERCHPSFAASPVNG